MNRHSSVKLAALLSALSISNLHADLTDFAAPGESASSADVEFTSSGGEMRMATDDIDGDGLDDVVIGTTAGENAYLFLGSSLKGKSSVNVESDADYSFILTSKYDTGCSDIAILDDYDGDGMKEIVFSYNQGTVYYAKEEGTVYFFMSSIIFADTDHELEATHDGITLEGSAHEMLGSQLATDGYNILIASGQDKQVYLTDISMVISVAGGFTGYDLLSHCYLYQMTTRNVDCSVELGDINGDGVSDAIIADPSANIVDIVLGGATSLSLPLSYKMSDYRLIGVSGDYLGEEALSGTGDLDGDGKTDLVIGAPGNSKAYIILGKTIASSSSANIVLSKRSDYILLGETAADGAGTSVALNNDVDGDGKQDIIIGAPYSDDPATDAGRTYVFLNSTLTKKPKAIINMAKADYIVTGSSTIPNCGASLSGAADINGDGLGDILTSSFFNSIFLIYGSR